MAGAMNQLRTDMAQRFIDSLSQGKLPWSACWHSARPANAITGKQYKGVNALMLSFIADEKGYTDPRWCTYKQAQEKGWQVRKGETGSRVEYWAYYDRLQKKMLSWNEVRSLLKADPKYEENLLLRSRIYTVFNGEQIEGIPAYIFPRTDIGELRQQRDTLLHNMNLRYEEGGSEAYYSPTHDLVHLPPEQTFDTTYDYMATLLHECGHATGHGSRLGRDLTGRFGTPEYAKEELRAEIASAFTTQALHLDVTAAQIDQHMDNHVAYIQSWISVLKDSPEELFRAIKAAEEISDYLIEKGEFDLELTQHQDKPLGEVSYTLSRNDDGNGLRLTVTGTGAMPDLTGSQDRPYHGYASQIREAVVTDGVTTVGAYTLADLPNLEKITLQGSVSNIGHHAIDNCPSLRECDLRNQRVSFSTRDLVSPADLLRCASRYPQFTREQLCEVVSGLKDGMSQEQISVYAKEELSPLQMNAIRYALADGLSQEQIDLLANPKFDGVKMEILRISFGCGMTMEQVKGFADPAMPAREMLDAHNALREELQRQPQLTNEDDYEPEFDEM